MKICQKKAEYTQKSIKAKLVRTNMYQHIKNIYAKVYKLQKKGGKNKTNKN